MSKNSLHAALPSNQSPIDSTGQRVISETTEPSTWNCVQASKQQPTLKAPANLSLDAGEDLYFWVTRDQSLLDTHPRFIHWLKRFLELRKPIYLLDKQLLQRIFFRNIEVEEMHRARYKGKRPYSPMPSPGTLISQSSTSLPIPKCTKPGGGLYEHHPWAGLMSSLTTGPSSHWEIQGSNQKSILTMVPPTTSQS